MKRRAEYELDPKAIEKDEEKKIDANESDEKVNMRQIYLIKGPKAGVCTDNENNNESSKNEEKSVKFQLKGNLDSTQEKNEVSSKPIFNFDVKPDLEKQSLFINAFPKNGDNETKENSESKSHSIFGNLSAVGQTSATTNLFSNPGTNLFSNIGGGGLFSNLQSSTNNSTGLFSNLGSFQSNGGLFNQGNSEDDDDGEVDGKSQDSEEKVDPSLSTGNFQYIQEFEKLITKVVHKFKVEEKDFEQGSVSIERHKDQGYCKLVFRNNVKIVLFDGFIMKKLTKYAHLNKRAELLSIIAYQINGNSNEKAAETNKENENSKDDSKEHEQKINKNLLPKNCKMKFSSGEECDQFIAELDKILEND